MELTREDFPEPETPVTDLKGEEGDSNTYGTCEVTQDGLVCTLNANVEGKNDVGGDLWLAVQAVETFDDDSLEFTYSNNGKVTVPWINGIDVGYRPAPGDTLKEGWPTDEVDNGVFWRIAVRGSDLAGATSTTITDTFAMPGHNFTVVDGYPRVYTLKTTDQCWSLQYSDDCRVDLPDELHELGVVPEVLARRRFVEDQDLRAHHQARCDRHPFVLPV